MADAIVRLAAEGTTADELGELLEQAEVRLVLTAHPTEARRRTTLEKLARVFGELRALDERREDLPGAAVAARERLRPTVQELWGSDELRAASLSVIDEVRGGIIYFETTLADAVPRIYRDLETAVAESYPDGVPVPPLLGFGSWIGGDRDGNPHVTPDVTLEALELMRDRCLAFLGRRLEVLAERLSYSERVTGQADGIAEMLERGAELFPELTERMRERNAEEPYRRAFTYAHERVRAARRGRAGAYAGPDELLADLRAAAHALSQGPGGAAAAGDLHDVIRQVEVFGFHFARLDVRENAKVHRAALDEIFRVVEVCEGYSDLPGGERCEVLCQAIADHRPLIPQDVSGFSDSTQECVQTFRALHEALTGRHRDTIEAYVVSHSEGPQDLLEVLLLMKESRLARAGGRDAMLRIVPLFESGDTLEAAPEHARRPDGPRGLPRGAGRDGRPPGGHGRLLGLQQGRGLRGLGLGHLPRAAGHRRGARAPRRVVGVLPRPRRRGGPRRRAHQHRHPGAARRHGRRTAQGHRAGRGAGRQVRGGRDRPARAGADHQRGPVLQPRWRDAAGRRPARALPGRRRADGRRGRPRPTARWCTATPTSSAPSPPSRRWTRSPACGWARARPSAPPTAASTTCAPSRGCSRGPRRGSCCRRGSAWARRWPTRARSTALDLLREMEREWPFFSALLSNAEMACAKADASIAARYFDLWEDAEPRERIRSAVEEEFDRTREPAGRRAGRGAAAGPPPGAAGLDRPPQPVRGPAVLRADRAAAPAAQRATATTRRWGGCRC